jgi:hypothetical protein
VNGTGRIVPLTGCSTGTNNYSAIPATATAVTVPGDVSTISHLNLIYCCC